MGDVATQVQGNLVCAYLRPQKLRGSATTSSDGCQCHGGIGSLIGMRNAFVLRFAGPTLSLLKLASCVAFDHDKWSCFLTIAKR
jgi:hypothetical protein